MRGSQQHLACPRMVAVSSKWLDMVVRMERMQICNALPCRMPSAAPLCWLQADLAVSYKRKEHAHASAPLTAGHAHQHT